VPVKASLVQQVVIITKAISEMTEKNLLYG